MLFTSLGAASDLKSGPVFFSQLNVSPNSSGKIGATLVQKSFPSLQASPFVAYYRPEIFVGKSKPAEVPAPVNFEVKDQVVSHTMGIQAPHRPTGSLWPAGFGILILSH